MSNCVIRSPLPGELPELHSLWDAVFGSVGKNSFFDCIFSENLCIVAMVEDRIATAGYLVPAGEIRHGSISVPCAMIYSVATLQKYRGMGFGAAVVRELIRVARTIGFPAVVLCPMNDGLFEFYSKRTGMKDFFYAGDRIIKGKPAVIRSDRLEEITADGYLHMRKGLLEGILHIKHDPGIFEYQGMLCKELGGGLFRFGDSCAVVDLQQDGAVWVKELLASDSDIDDFISAIAAVFPANEYVIRYPPKNGEGRRFGMLYLQDEIFSDIAKNDPAPWYGMAFD